jgi:hypothetical protein
MAQLGGIVDSGSESKHRIDQVGHDIPVGTSSWICSAGSVDRLNNWVGASAATQLSGHVCALQPEIDRAQIDALVGEPVSTSASPWQRRPHHRLLTKARSDTTVEALQLLTAAPSNDRGTDRMTDVHKTANIKHRRAKMLRTCHVEPFTVALTVSFP